LNFGILGTSYYLFIDVPKADLGRAFVNSGFTAGRNNNEWTQKLETKRKALGTILTEGRHVKDGSYITS
jgi:hypothetical protein